MRLQEAKKIVQRWGNLVEARWTELIRQAKAEGVAPVERRMKVESFELLFLPAGIEVKYGSQVKSVDRDVELGTVLSKVLLQQGELSLDVLEEVREFAAKAIAEAGAEVQRKIEEKGRFLDKILKGMKDDLAEHELVKDEEEEEIEFQGTVRTSPPSKPLTIARSVFDIFDEEDAKKREKEDEGSGRESCGA